MFCTVIEFVAGKIENWYLNSLHRDLNSGSTATVKHTKPANHLSHVADNNNAFIENILMHIM